jgi:hypothetical protein
MLLQAHYPFVFVIAGRRSVHSDLQRDGHRPPDEVLGVIAVVAAQVWVIAQRLCSERVEEHPEYDYQISSGQRDAGPGFFLNGFLMYFLKKCS